MRRRAVVMSLGGAAALSVRPGARAQQRPRRMARVAVLSPGVSETRSVFVAFRMRLRELGYQEGRDVALEFHFANGGERLASLAQAIARDGADLVLADGRLAAQAMHAASRTMPIVAVTGLPVESGLAANLARPGGNVTGIATMSTELGAKQLEFLHEILPAARRIGVVDASISAPSYSALEERAAALGVTLRRILLRTQIDAERELTPAALRDVDGLVLPPSALIAQFSAILIRLIDAAVKPAIYGDRDFVAAGGLIFYSIDIDDAFRRAASLVDRVLKGADPATTPFEQPTRITLSVNLKTAKALDLTLPPAIIARADEVIE